MTHLTGKGVRVQLSTHLSARVVYTTDTPTSLYYMDTPTSLYDGGAYTGGCIRSMDISDGSSTCSRYTPFIPPCTPHTVHAYGEAHTEGCAYTNIDDASQDTGKGVRVQLSTYLRARVVCTVDTPTSLYRWGEAGEGRTPGTRGEGRRATAGA